MLKDLLEVDSIELAQANVVEVVDHGEPRRLRVHIGAAGAARLEGDDVEASGHCRSRPLPISRAVVEKHRAHFRCTTHVPDQCQQSAHLFVHTGRRITWGRAFPRRR